VREARNARGLVEELGMGNLSVLGFGGRAPDNGICRRCVHFPHNVLEGRDVCIGDLGCSFDADEGAEIVQDMLGQLVPCRLLDNSHEVGHLNKPSSLGIKAMEGLTNILALDCSQELRELLVRHCVSVLRRTGVQGRPGAVSKVSF
jgi:hypothetical protein